MAEEWRVYNVQADFTAIGNSLGVSPKLAKILCNRKLRTYDEMMNYLYPEQMSPHSPALLPDVEKAAGILKEAIQCGRKIRIIGDYDVDGVTAIAILYRSLKRLVMSQDTLDWQVPHRVLDGFGLNVNMIEQARQDHIDLILTCDNGIAAAREIALAKEYGISVVVTDHHEVPEGGGSIAVADAVVNPKCPDSAYPYKEICGAMVAWKFMGYLYDRMEGHSASELEPLLEYVTLATVADVMDLRDENRALVRRGLERIHESIYPGLQKLMEACKIVPANVGSYTIGFQIAPTLNAGGRLETAQKAVELLITEDETEAVKLADELVNLNTRRKELTEKAVEEARVLIENGDYREDRVLVVYLPNCHESIAGIVAGRIRERFYRPTFILTPGVEGIKGSGRSIEGYDMFHEMEKVGDCFSKFGGHEMAAGLSLNQDRVSEFRTRINENCTLMPKELTETIWIDLSLAPGQVDLAFARELGLLEPFGKGNETPVFATRNLLIRRLQVFGKERKGLKILYQDENQMRGELTYWGDPEEFHKDLSEVHGEEVWESLFQVPMKEIRMLVIYQIGVGSFRGEEYPRLTMKKYRFS